MAEPLPEPTLAAEERDVRGARKELWRRGNLQFKFKDRPWQERMYQWIRATLGATLVLLAHRRSGKSSCGLIVAIEECLRTPRTSVAIVCGTKDQARAICEEILGELIGDCPAECAPRRIKNDFLYKFDHNGSQIFILAADGPVKTRIRGRKFKFIVLMEAAFIPSVTKLVRSVLAPTTRDVLSRFRGTILLETTAPDETVAQEDVEKFEEMWNEAQLEGRSFFLPLSQNTDASPEFVADCKKDCGGEETLDYLVEYECQFGLERASTAVPEFTPASSKALVRELSLLPGADRYGGMDPGGTHPTALLWAHYRAAEDLLVIEDEEMLRNPTTAAITSCVRAKERALWGETPSGKLRRYSDNDNPTLLRDLRAEGLRFDASDKLGKRALVSRLRGLVRDGRIAIHPRCRRLIKTMMLARWHKIERKGFAEMRDGLGHADLLDALLYIVRNVKRDELPAELRLPQVEQERNEPVRMPAGMTSSDQAFMKALRRNFGRR